MACQNGPCERAGTPRNEIGVKVAVTMPMNNPEPSAVRLLEKVLSAVRGAERLLGGGSASVLFVAAAELETAVNACAELQQQAPTLPPQIRRQAADALAQIRAGLRRVGALMNSAAEFHAGWARVAGMGAAAYGPDGSELGLPSDAGRGSHCDASG